METEPTQNKQNNDDEPNEINKFVHGCLEICSRANSHLQPQDACAFIAASGDECVERHPGMKTRKLAGGETRNVLMRRAGNRSGTRALCSSGSQPGWVDSEPVPERTGVGCTHRGRIQWKWRTMTTSNLPENP
jgi:hypothetical protein